MTDGNYRSINDSEYLDAVETMRRCEIHAGFGYYDGIKIGTTATVLIKKVQRYIDEAEHFHSIGATEDEHYCVQEVIRIAHRFNPERQPDR